MAHAEHLLDRFRALRARHAILEPLLFDAQVIGRIAAGRRGFGMHVLTAALLDTCVLDIAKIVHDGDERSPCLGKLVAALEDVDLLAELREAFAVWHLAPTSGNTPDVIALLQAAERREEEERRQKFASLVDELRTRATALASSQALSGFRTMRDKLIAHSQLTFDGRVYRPVDVTTLSLTLGDIRSAIDEIEVVIDLLTLVFRNSAFDFQMLREQLTIERDAFWAPAP